MASPILELNFFPVRFPASVPFLVRPLADGEKLLDGERRWSRPAVGSGGLSAIFVKPEPPSGHPYQEEHRPIADAPAGSVLVLISAALGARLATAGYDTEDERVGFSAFLPKHTFPDIADLAFLRGVDLRPDYLVDRGRKKHFGFFVSMRVRRRFARSHMDDPSQLKAGLGEGVRLRSTEHRGKWRLMHYDLERDSAEVTNGETTVTVSLDRVVVPPSHNILVRYGGLVGRPELAAEAMGFERRLTFRYQGNGRLNPSWLAKQRDFVTTWLIEAAQFGRIDFGWCAATFSMAIQPLRLEGSQRE
jgi:hypothetical protein